ncbi:uncharacterized protein BCR38DRAFT_482005 [Pseudomassariella vexata]|uniref:Uncharacterized protein n=1 Tax=Pseudomassariella vexata TaxID=1141098 RepID=A0A1Y2EB79_9PEZI|nr:uncharacterized protein BCR38DRAFT_482005 [Pseudomassariella vexata]ORY68516.1 hypothetical protein BCR38DRAFT_482005 [Pseudomassariella vexata]
MREVIKDMRAELDRDFKDPKFVYESRFWRIQVYPLKTAHRSTQFAEEIDKVDRANAKRIINSLKHAVQFAPLGAIYMTLPAVIAYHVAVEKRKDWV